MPALNVEFSERELADLRQIAKERGTSMKALVREAVAADIARHRALQEGAETFRSFFAAHAGEFAAAFPDDEPAVRSAPAPAPASAPAPAPPSASADGEAA
ncbi:hypothetical protein [Streptomyces sp. NPDC047024]|uniref:hypothetical protein n=1 Tax=Streptomyces sp. NPDC047024 TaxID=3155476 RepID=UPI0033DBBD40